MSRVPFRGTDVKRIVRALEDAGKKVTCVEIEGERIKIKLKNGNDADDDDTDDTNPWDEVDLK